MTAFPIDLSGTRVLVVEDEYYLADDLCRALADAGAEVIGPIATLDEAERVVASERFDCAVVDMNLRGDAAFPLADRLDEAGVPFLIATGYNSVALPERLQGRPRVEKPFDVRQIVAAIPPLIRPQG
jgi:DNA-binding response OmpR family regulator